MFIEAFDLGTISYAKAMVWQQSLAEKRRQDAIPDTLLLLEHPPLFTAGKRDSSSDFIKPESWILRQGLEIHKTDRGGRLTYHGPGQLVVYFLFRLSSPIPDFVRHIEEAIIDSLASFHLEAHRDDKHPGVWIHDKKIAALGFHVGHEVTTHGFSLNVSCDLRPYGYINPCGIQGRGVTSVEKELGWAPSMTDVKKILLKNLAKIFGRSVRVVGVSEALSE